MQPGGRQGHDLVGDRLIDAWIAREQLRDAEDGAQLLQIFYRRGNLDLVQGGRAVATLNQGGDLGRPNTVTGHGGIPQEGLIGHFDTCQSG